VVSFIASFKIRQQEQAISFIHFLLHSNTATNIFIAFLDDIHDVQVIVVAGTEKGCF
jgi:hypothetical protein